MKMTYFLWPPPNMNLIGEECDSFGTDSLTVFVRNHWATGWLRVNSTLGEGYDYKRSFFAHTGLKCKGQQSVIAPYCIFSQYLSFNFILQLSQPAFDVIGNIAFPLSRQTKDCLYSLPSPKLKSPGNRQ